MNAYLARAAQIAVDREERATLGITDPRRTELFQRIARNLEQQRRVEANGEYCRMDNAEITGSALLRSPG